MKWSRHTYTQTTDGEYYRLISAKSAKKITGKNTSYMCPLHCKTYWMVTIFLLNFDFISRETTTWISFCSCMKNCSLLWICLNFFLFNISMIITLNLYPRRRQIWQHSYCKNTTFSCTKKIKPVKTKYYGKWSKRRSYHQECTWHCFYLVYSQLSTFVLDPDIACSSISGNANWSILIYQTKVHIQTLTKIYFYAGPLSVSTSIKCN